MTMAATVPAPVEARRRDASEAYRAASRAWEILWYEIGRSRIAPLQGVYRQLYVNTICYHHIRFENCIPSTQIASIVECELDRSVAALHLRHMFTVANDFDAILLRCEDGIFASRRAHYYRSVSGLETA